MAWLKTCFHLARRCAWAFTFGMDTRLDRRYRPATRLNTLHFPFVVMIGSAIADLRLAVDGTVRNRGSDGDDRSDPGVSGRGWLGRGPPEAITSIGRRAIFLLQLRFGSGQEARGTFQGGGGRGCPPERRARVKPGPAEGTSADW